MRKIALLLLAAMLLFAGFPSFQAAAAEPDTEDKFEFLREKGIFTGFADGSAGLHLAMSREQFAAVLFRLWDLREVTGVPSFSDVPKNRWSYGEIEAVADAGLMKGSGYRKFTPLAKVSVEQLAAVLVRAYGASGSAADRVGGKVSAWARQDVGIALAKGWIPSQADYRLDAGRGMLVDASYEVYLDLHPEENPFGEKLDVHSVEPLSATTILVHLRTSVKSAVKEQFRLEDEGGRQVRITNAALNGSGTVVTLTTDKQVAGDIHTLAVDGRSWSFRALADDRTKPQITSSKINADATIELGFSEALRPETAVNKSNYSFNYSLSITNIVLSGDKKKVTITTGKQTAGTVYTLTVSGVADAAGNVMDTRSNLYFGAVVDSTPPTIAGVSADKNKVVLTFSERLEEQYAENIASYMFDGGLGLPLSAVYVDGERRVTLTTSDQTPGKVYTVTVNFVRDRAGNTIAQNTKRSFSGAGKASTEPIELQNVKPVNENTIELTFGRSVSGVGISGLKAVIESDNGSSVNNSGWQIFAQRKQGDDRTLTVQFRTSGDGSPNLFRQGRVYVVSVTGLTGLNTADDANEKRFAGIDEPNPQPYVTRVEAVNSTAVRVFFNEPVKNVQTGSFRLADSEGRSVPVVGEQVHGRDKIVTEAVLNLDTKLKPGETYRMSFAGGVTDAAGWNGLRTKSGDDPYRVAFTGTDTDNAAPRIETVFAEDRYTIVVRFSEPVANADQNVFNLYNETDRDSMSIVKGDDAGYAMSADRQQLFINLYPGETGPLRANKSYRLTYKTDSGKIADLQGKRLDTLFSGSEIRFSGNDRDNARPSIVSVEAWSTVMYITLSEEVTGFNGQTNLFEIRVGNKTAVPASGSIHGKTITLRMPKLDAGSTGSIRVSAQGAAVLRDAHRQALLTDLLYFNIQ